MASLQWLASNRKLSPEKLERFYYCYRDLEAMRHLIKVASGIDSLVLGEPQIFGQIKSAYAVACEAGTVSSSLNNAFQYGFTAAKRVLN